MNWTTTRFTFGAEKEAATHMLGLIKELERDSARAWLVKERPGRAVFRIPARQARYGAVIAKYHQPRSVMERVKYAVLPTRAAREWKNAERLRAAGVPVPDMLALGEFWEYGWWWTRAVLFARAIEPGTPLNDYLLASPPAADVRRLGLRLAGHVARLHDAGYRARDLHGWNIVLRHTAAGADLSFVDLDEMRPRATPWHLTGADDLARLGVLAPVGMFTKRRFLVAYLRARRVPRARRRKWSAEVAKRAAHIATGLKEKYGQSPDEFIRSFALERKEI